jgi:uncharacterized damage-inducible protein DinB
MSGTGFFMRSTAVAGALACAALLQGCASAEKQMYVDWIAGVRSLDEDALAEPCREEGHEQDTMAALILHIHREVIHHGAEISLLRDLYAWRISTPDAAERRRVS